MTDRKDSSTFPEEEEEISEAQLQAIRAQMRIRLSELFRRSGQQEPTRFLFDYLVRYRSDPT